MIQYYMMKAADPTIIKDKSGNILKVHDFRKRVKYNKADVVINKMKEGELLRVDLLSIRLYGSRLNIANIIDVNDEDVFSFNTNDPVNYVNPSEV